MAGTRRGYGITWTAAVPWLPAIEISMASTNNSMGAEGGSAQIRSHQGRKAIQAEPIGSFSSIAVPIKLAFLPAVKETGVLRICGHASRAHRARPPSREPSERQEARSELSPPTAVHTTARKLRADTSSIPSWHRIASSGTAFRMGAYGLHIPMPNGYTTTLLLERRWPYLTRHLRACTSTKLQMGSG